MPKKVRARSATAAVAGKNGHSLISDEKFRQLYATMLKYSLLEERMCPGSNGTFAGADSNIAGAVGVALDLGREDTVVLTPRSFLTNFVKGVPLQALLKHRHMNGNAPGAAFGYSAVNALMPPSPTVSVQLGFATGAALANKLAKNRKIAVAFVENGAEGLAGYREALELACAQKLPILYVIEKVPDELQKGILREIGELFPVITVDSNDVVAVYRVAQESIARVREGGGPALIACVAYPLNGAQLNAIANMERYLTGKKLFRNRWKAKMISEFKREMDAEFPASG